MRVRFKIKLVKKQKNIHFIDSFEKNFVAYKYILMTMVHCNNVVHQHHANN